MPVLFLVQGCPELLLPLSGLSASVLLLPRVSWTLSSCSAPLPPSLLSPVRCAPGKVTAVSSTTPRTYFTALEGDLGSEAWDIPDPKGTEGPAVSACLFAQGLGRAERSMTPCFFKADLSRGLFSPAQNEQPGFTCSGSGPSGTAPSALHSHSTGTWPPAQPTSPKKGPGQALKPWVTQNHTLQSKHMGQVRLSPAGLCSGQAGVATFHEHREA